MPAAACLPCLPPPLDADIFSTLIRFSRYCLRAVAAFRPPAPPRCHATTRRSPAAAATFIADVFAAQISIPLPPPALPAYGDGLPYFDAVRAVRNNAKVRRAARGCRLMPVIDMLYALPRYAGFATRRCRADRHAV